MPSASRAPASVNAIGPYGRRCTRPCSIKRRTVSDAVDAETASRWASQVMVTGVLDHSFADQMTLR